MSAVRKDSLPTAPRPPSPLTCAKRFLEPEQFALLEKIVSLREMDADWSVVCDVTGLHGTAKDFAVKLRPYLWLLVALRSIAFDESWTEIAGHPWIKGGIALSTILNKRKAAALCIGLKFDEFVTEYGQAWNRMARELIGYHAERDAQRIRDFFERDMAQSEALQAKIDAELAEAELLSPPVDSIRLLQPPLELVDKETGEPMSPEPPLKRHLRRLDAIEQIARTKRHLAASADIAHKNFRLMTGQSTENISEVDDDPANLSEEQLREREARADAALAEAERELALIEGSAGSGEDG